MEDGELGRYPLCVAVKKRIIGHCERLIEGKDAKLKSIYVQLLIIIINYY